MDAPRYLGGFRGFFWDDDPTCLWWKAVSSSGGRGGGEGERDRSLDLRDPLFRRSSLNRTDDFVSDRMSRAGEFFLRVESLLFLEPREDRSGGEAERDREGVGERDRGCRVSPRPHDRD